MPRAMHNRITGRRTSTPARECPRLTATLWGATRFDLRSSGRPWFRECSAVPGLIERDKVQRVHGDRTVPRCPVKVRARHASRGADLPDDLAARNGVALGDQRLGQVEVPGDDAA